MQLLNRFTISYHMRVIKKISFSVLGLGLLVSAFITSCDTLKSIDEESDFQSEFEYNFHESDHGWEAFFTNYNDGWEEKMDLQADYRSLPEPLDTIKSALYISGVNHSDDVKMLFRKQVDGLKPNSTYDVRFLIQFATSVPSNCAGIGGSPGEAVKVIADASTNKPEAILDDNEYYILNNEHESNAAEWYQNAILGDIANSRECEEGPEFEIKELISDEEHVTVATDDSGQAWLLFGTRSGFEGRTELFYTYLKANFEETDE